MQKNTIEKILLEFDSEPYNLLPALRGISAVFGYISEINAQKIAEYFSVPLSKVYETASFYDQINVRKQSRTLIQVCSGTNCAISNSFEIVRELENTLRIKAGDENNPKIKLEVISCLGRCGEGPIIIVNNKIYERVTVSVVHKILEEWM